MAGIPHHVTQRGRQGRPVFVTDEERRAWLDRLFELAGQCGVRVAGYCLMADHIHLVAAPDRGEGLTQLMRRLQADYARAVNFFRRGSGRLWDGRYAACPMSEPDAMLALAHIELNPVRTGLVRHAVQYRWSSARAHLMGEDPEGRLDLTIWARHFSPEAWRQALKAGVPEEWVAQFRKATRRGSPLGLEAPAGVRQERAAWTATERIRRAGAGAARTETSAA